jgi:hypothetical protein
VTRSRASAWPIRRPRLCAVRHIAPLACLVYDFVLLWAAENVHAAVPTGWLHRPWYREKVAPSFLDMLTALYHAGGRRHFSAPPCGARRTEKPLIP